MANRKPSRSTVQSKHKTSDETLVPCLECKQTILEEEKSIVCQMCERREHAKCAKIDDVMFRKLEEKSIPGLNYFCEGCDIVASGILKNLTALTHRVEKVERKVEDLQKKMPQKVDQKNLKQAFIDNLNDAQSQKNHKRTSFYCY